jgi:two-component system cell cycle sensor histidine kinase/response regulator CckA
MLETNVESVFRIANIELRRRIALLEETLLAKELTGVALAAQFQQAQKMEAVGLLAGGVAHDYNNMLNVILGYAELALLKVDQAHSLHADLEEIIKAVKHSTAITRQLLTFARKQTIIPMVLDLNQNVESMLKMLRRLIGENINLVWLPEAGHCPVKMDPSQIDQILINLCVNARDAIADIGKVTIETGNAFFDETYCAQHNGFVAGKYVLLAVSDDGCGMGKEILNQIFEPFFTCKEVGEGTGLGLSTVHSIVKQNNGFINVYSEPENGTTFRIYLPRHTDRAVDTRHESTAEIPPSCGETVLVVEDEPALLTIAKVMLEELGYRVLTAGTPGEAIELAEEHANEIQLLITDVVMPKMNGRDLAEWMHSLYPGMKILFMSGYPANMIVHRGVLGEDRNFIQKPFSMQDLAVKVRDAVS